MEDLFSSFLGNIAFPILVSVFLLTRIEKKLAQLNTTIIELSNLINKDKT